jgi:SAM-dependent methyltransferase
MGKYHPYVFDIGKRKFVGEFEEMYANEEKDNYDSWYQENLTSLKCALTLDVLNQYNFDSILDVGCGKGAITHLLKKKNNRVLGVDISETAIKKAKAKFPAIDFQVLKANDVLSLNQKFDLVVCIETLSYMENWKEFIENISKISKYFYVYLYVPENPIGFVKSFEDLSGEVEKYFDIKHKIVNQIGDDSSILIMGERKWN